MDCREVRDYLSLYIDGAIDDDKASDIERHLIGCEACQLELKKYIRIKEALNSFEDLPLPEGYNERLKKKLHSVEARPPFIKWIAAAAVVVVIVSGVHLISINGAGRERVADVQQSIDTHEFQAEDATADRPEGQVSTSQYSMKKEESNSVGSEKDIEIESSMKEAESRKDVSGVAAGCEKNTKNVTYDTGKTAEGSNRDGEGYGMFKTDIAQQQAEDVTTKIEEIIKNTTENFWMRRRRMALLY